MRTVVAWTLWWLVLFWLWNAMQGTWEAMEIAAGAGAAAIGATFAEAVRRQRLLAFAPEARWLVRAFRLLWRLPYEFAIVTLALFRPHRVRGQWSVSPLPTGRTASVRDGNRAAVLATENVAPNTMAIETEAGDAALKHDLVPGKGAAALPS